MKKKNSKKGWRVTVTHFLDESEKQFIDWLGKGKRIKEAASEIGILT